MIILLALKKNQREYFIHNMEPRKKAIDTLQMHIHRSNMADKIGSFELSLTEPASETKLFPLVTSLGQTKDL